jgi:hypothetical protein
MFLGGWWTQEIEGWMEDEILDRVMEGTLFKKINWNYLFGSFSY